MLNWETWESLGNSHVVKMELRCPLHEKKKRQIHATTLMKGWIVEVAELSKMHISPIVLREHGSHLNSLRGAK